MVDENLREKVLKRLTEFAEQPTVELHDHGTSKKAYIKKAFQAEGQLFCIQLLFTHTLHVEGTNVYIKEDHSLVKYNSRSTEGGYYYYTLEDIAKALGLTVADMEPIFRKLENASKLKPNELLKAKEYLLGKIQKAVTKLVVA